MNVLPNNAYNINYFQIIGRGAFGTVFHCTSQQFPNQQLCVKKIGKIKNQNGFFTENNVTANRETAILKSLQYIQNPHIIKVIDIFEDDQFINIVMEYCAQGELHNLIQQRKTNNIKPTAKQTLDFIYQFCDGYSVIYDNNILHRDIKPQNVLLSKEEAGLIFKIADFGAARILENMVEKNDYTKSGTYMYASPQVVRSLNFSSKTDVYSFGILLYEWIFSKLPYESNLKAMMTFQTSIMNTPFKANLTLNGSVEELNEIKEILEHSIVYEEDKRIDWESLIQRSKTLNVYPGAKQYSQQNHSIIKTQQEQSLHGSVIIQQRPQKTSICQKIRIISKCNHPLSSYLKLQLIKKQLAQNLIDNLIQSITNRQFFIPNLEFYCFLTSILAYQFNLLQNMQAIYENNYTQVCLQIQVSTTLEQFNDVVTEFLQSMQGDDRNVQQDVQNALTAINYIFKVEIGINQFQNHTIELISNQKIRLMPFVEFKNDLQNVNTPNGQVDYFKFWKWIQYFNNQYISKILTFSDQELQTKMDCVLLYFAFVILLNQIEISHPQQTLNQFEKEEDFPNLSLDKEKAKEILMMSRQFE